MVQVRGANNQLSMRQATVLEMDRVHDLVVMRIEGAAVPPLAIRNSDAVREGQAIAFMGFPIGGVLGFSPVTHRGIVSSITPAVLPAANARQLADAESDSPVAGPKEAGFGRRSPEGGRRRSRRCSRAIW